MANYKKFIYVSNTVKLTKLGETAETTFASEAEKWTYVQEQFAPGKPWHKSIIFRAATNEIYNRGIAYGLNPTDAARIKTLEDWRDALDVEENTVDGTNAHVTYKQVDGTVTITGVSEDYATITFTPHANAEGENAEVKATIVFGDATDQSKLIKASDLKKATDYAKDIVAEEKADRDKAVAKATSTVTAAAGTGLVVTPDSNATDQHTEYKLTQNVKFVYYQAVANTAAVGEESNAVPAHIELQDATNSAKLAEFKVSDIIGNGVLDSSSYDNYTGILTLTFKQADGTTKAESIDLKEMLDINDMSIAGDSQNYLEVSLQGETEDSTQAVFGAKIKKMSEVTADVLYVDGDEIPEGKSVGDIKTPGATGLTDAKDVKDYIDKKSTDLAVTASGDSYVGAKVEDSDNKHVIITTNTADPTVSAGTRGTWTVTDAGAATLSGETNPSLSGTSGKLLDAQKALEAVTTYVDAKVAQEAAERDAKISGAVKALDVVDLKSKNASDEVSNNIELTLNQTDGKVTSLTIDEKYATVTRTTRVAASETYDIGTDATAPKLEVTNNGYLVKGSDLELVVSYVGDLDTRITNRVKALEDEVLDWAEC